MVVTIIMLKTRYNVWQVHLAHQRIWELGFLDHFGVSHLSGAWSGSHYWWRSDVTGSNVQVTHEWQRCMDRLLHSLYCAQRYLVRAQGVSVH